MDGAALQLFSTLRGDHWGDGPGTDVESLESLEAFAALVLGRSPGALDEQSRALIKRVARGAQGTRAQRFATIYSAVRGMAAPAPRRKARSAALALERLPYLRHQQRAALGLRCVLGFRDDEVAQVLGVSEREAVIVVEAGIANVRRRDGVEVQPPAAAEPQPAAAPRETDDRTGREHRVA